MPIDLQKEIFSRNLSKYVSLSGKTQTEIAKSIGVSQQTFNTWMQGIAIPRMGKIQALADYFKIMKSDLVDEKPDDPYYEDSTAAIAQEIFDNQELRLLFDAAKDADPEDLKTVHAMLLALKRKENRT